MRRAEVVVIMMMRMWDENEREWKFLSNFKTAIREEQLGCLNWVEATVMKEIVEQIKKEEDYVLVAIK